MSRPQATLSRRAFLRRLVPALEEHMQKDEQVLFPLVRAGRGRTLAMPVQVLEHEHA